MLRGLVALILIPVTTALGLACLAACAIAGYDEPEL